MDDRKALLEKTKEELVEIILTQEQRIKTLEDKLSIRKKDPPEFIKPDTRVYHHKPGQKPGHEGISRLLPANVDETIEQSLETCPHCQSKLGSPTETTEHIQEDIIPAHVRVTKYRRNRYWCPCCHKIIDAPYHKTEVPASRIGPNALIQAAILKYNHCLPYRKIAEVLKELSGLNVSAGALAQSLQRLSQWLNIEQQTILEAIRAGPVVHIDETGWRLDGKNHWLWAFVNEKLAYYRIERSRGRRIVKDTLNDNYSGTIITDFYGVYFKLPYKKQKCLVHLLRELRNTAKHDDSRAYCKFYKQIRRLVNDAVKLKEIKSSLAPVIFQRRFRRIKERLFMLIGDKHSENKNVSRIASRFSKFWLDMLTFLEIDNVAWNNNLAERLIRPHVIYRNRSFGNRSQEGIRTHETLTSLIQTLLLQKRSVCESLKTAFIAHRQGEIKPLLFVPASKS
jgi:transposase